MARGRLGFVNRPEQVFELQIFLDREAAIETDTEQLKVTSGQAGLPR